MARFVLHFSSYGRIYIYIVLINADKERGRFAPFYQTIKAGIHLHVRGD